jgi:hypothetical protein
MEPISLSYTVINPSALECDGNVQGAIDAAVGDAQETANVARKR